MQMVISAATVRSGSAFWKPVISSTGSNYAKLRSLGYWRRHTNRVRSLYLGTYN